MNEVEQLHDALRWIERNERRLVEECERLDSENERLREAIKAVLSYISSHQVYDKDARGILERALNPPEGQR